MQIGELLRLHDASCAAIDERGADLTKLETELSVQRRAHEGLQDDVASEQDEARKWRTQLEMAREEGLGPGDRLPSIKAPKSVEFVDEIPRSQAGKLYRKRLRDELWQDEARSI